MLAAIKANTLGTPVVSGISVETGRTLAYNYVILTKDTARKVELQHKSEMSASNPWKPKVIGELAFNTDDAGKQIITIEGKTYEFADPTALLAAVKSATLGTPVVSGISVETGRTTSYNYVILSKDTARKVELQHKSEMSLSNPWKPKVIGELAFNTDDAGKQIITV